MNNDQKLDKIERLRRESGEKRGDGRRKCNNPYRPKNIEELRRSAKASEEMRDRAARNE